MKRILSLFALAGLLTFTGCPQGGQGTSGGGTPEASRPNQGGGSADAAAAAKQKYDTLCTTCHGPQGKGDGPGAASLDPKPRDFTDPAWQDSVTDDHLRKVIVKGGPAVGKSPLMPPNPDLEGKPEVVNELVKFIRSLRKK